MEYLTKYFMSFKLKEDLLLLNTLSGAVDLVTGTWCSIISNLIPGTYVDIIDIPLRNYLKTRHYLFESVDVEKKAVSRLLAITNYPPNCMPKFYICPTYHCNLQCIYCNEWDIPSSSKQNRLITLQQIDDAFDAVRHIIDQRYSQSKANNIPVIYLFGGEPLLPSSRLTINHIFETSKRYGYKLSIISNGIHVPDYIDLLTLYKADIKQVQITLDGVQEIHDKRRRYPNGRGTFTLVTDAIDVLLNRGISVNMLVNLDAHNIPHLPRLVDLCSEKKWLANSCFRAALGKVMYPLCNPTAGYKYYLDDSEFIKQLAPVTEGAEFAPFDLPNGKMSSYKYLEQLIRNPTVVPSPLSNGCDATRNNIFLFGPDSLVYPCVDVAGFPKYAIGSYSPKLSIENTKNMFWSNCNPLKIDKCRKCPYLALCGGGCALRNIYKASDQIPNCPDVKGTIDTYISSHEKQIRSVFSSSAKGF
jgi:uncharacterized protein